MPFGASSPRERRGPRTPSGDEVATQRIVTEDAVDRGRERAGIRGVAVRHGVVPEFAQRGLVVGEHGHACLHRLEWREAEAFPQRRVHDEARVVQESPEFVVAAPSAPVHHAVPDGGVEFGDDAFARPADPPNDDEQRARLRQEAPCVEQGAVVLAWLDRSDAEHERPPRERIGVHRRRDVVGAERNDPRLGCARCEPAQVVGGGAGRRHDRRRSCDRRARAFAQRRRRVAVPRGVVFEREVVHGQHDLGAGDRRMHVVEPVEAACAAGEPVGTEPRAVQRRQAAPRDRQAMQKCARRNVDRAAGARETVREEVQFDVVPCGERACEFAACARDPGVGEQRRAIVECDRRGHEESRWRAPARRRDGGDGILLPNRTGMQRSTSLLLLSLAAVAVALGVVFAMAGESPPPAGPGVVAAEPDHPPVVGPRHQDPPPQLPTGAPHVHVKVRSIEPFLPPTPVRVRGFDPRGRELPVAPIAGAGAWFDEGDPRPGLALVAIGIEGGGSVLRQVAVEAVGPVRVDVGARLVVRGVVRDSEQKPLVGARVWLGESDAAGARRDVATDDVGAFELDVPAGSGVPFVVHAEGHASQWLPVVVATPPRDLSMSLPPSAPVAVQVVGSSQGIDAVRVFVVPGNEVATEIAQYPFFLQAITDGTAVEANGRATFSDLPQRGGVGIVVRHPLAFAETPAQVALTGRGVRVPVPLSLAPNVCSLRVVGEDGAALPGIAAWMRDRPDPVGATPSLRLLPPALGMRGACFARSDAQGIVSLGALPGAGALALRAPGRAGRELRWPLTTDEPIVLPVWLGDDCAFRLAPPKDGVVWSASSDLGSDVRATIAADRPWVVSFPGPGRFAVEITTSIDEHVVATEQRIVDVTGTIELASPRAP